MKHLKGSTVLVTGGAGFIGSHLCDELLRNGAKVVAVDNLLTGKVENLAWAKEQDGFQFVRGDVNRHEDLTAVFQAHKPDYVFHYAAILGVKRVMEEPLLVLNDIDGLRHILSLSKEHGVKKVVYASSSEAYGDAAFIPLAEDNPDLMYHEPDSQNLYSVVKLLGEKMMRIYAVMYDLPACSLRFFNVFGPRQETSAYGFVAGVFINQAIKDQPLTIFGDGYQTRDFVYIEDNVKIAIKALTVPDTNGETINVGIGRQTTIMDLAERIVRLSEKDLKIIHEPSRPYEIRYRAPEVTKMRKLLGDIEDHLDENLKKTYDYYARRNLP